MPVILGATTSKLKLALLLTGTVSVIVIEYGAEIVEVVGVPEISPVLVSNINPLGNVNGLIAYVYVPTPPVPVTGCIVVASPETNVNKLSDAATVNISETTSLTVIVNVPELVCPKISVANTKYVVVADVADGVPESSPFSLNVKPVGGAISKLYRICPKPFDATTGVTLVISLYLV